MAAAEALRAFSIGSTGVLERARANERWTPAEQLTQVIQVGIELGRIQLHSGPP